jgi:DMSO/TMAO reductase YedYZ molybdopterin-dependent catalytic subunit
MTLDGRTSAGKSGFVSRGFRRRRADPETSTPLPPGQYLVDGFPVLSAGPTPHTSLQEWDFTIGGAVDKEKRWTWAEFHGLPSRSFTADIHCVTKWSKLNTTWRGVSVDTLLDYVDHDAQYAVAYCDGGYTTNVALEDLVDGNAFVVFEYEGQPLEPEHGGPARLLVPRLYLWKSAKWVRGLKLTNEDEPGFWETLGYHNRGDPWQEQRYWGD